MKIKLLSAAIMLSSGLVTAGFAHAGTVSTTLDVTATVGMACTVTTTPVNFGYIPSGAGAITQGSITATCTPGYPYTIALNTGKNFDGFQRRITNGTGSYLSYDLMSPILGGPWGDGFWSTPWPALNTISTGNDVFRVDGFLMGGLVPDGIYSDVVDVTVSY